MTARRTTPVAPWRKRCWGVLMWGSIAEPPKLLGAVWAEPLVGTPYPGEPTRALLFCTRAQARAWCRDQNRKWREHGNYIVQAWRVRPVRVRETVCVEGMGDLVA